MTRLSFPLSDTERAYLTLYWTVWLVGVELWWERWGVSAGRA